MAMARPGVAIAAVVVLAVVALVDVHRAELSGPQHVGLHLARPASMARVGQDVHRRGLQALC